MKQGIKNNLLKRQMHGAVLVALSALIIAAIFGFHRERFYSVSEIPFGYSCEDCIAVEIDGNIKEKGIYFFRKGWRLSHLLTFLHFNWTSLKSASSNTDPSSLLLYDGIKIIVKQRQNERPLIEIGGMAASTRLALNRPLDLNRVSLEDLILVPGIGEKTALKILEARNKEGKFRQLEDLMKIKGIKEKRLEKLRPYLYV
ncbi:competence protein ComEA [Syntrophus gentianae]|uniref:Competence protein ComEA n=1 Tax=Syntrophus gentianae TaxID=43775 RepID=A0A1H7XEJ4_9BACT|nr:competence protein ComEA [Syntrophus gentianae]